MSMTMPVRPSVSQWWGLLKLATAAWSKDYAPSMGAALSYYTVFSLAPLLLLVISIAGLAFGQDAARHALMGQLDSMMGQEASAAVNGLLDSVSKPAEGVVGTVVGMVLLLIGATSVFGELQDALDRIWRAPQRAGGSGVWALLRTRLLSFGMILGIAFLLMVSLVISAAIAAMGEWWAPLFGGWELLAQAVTFVVGFVLTTVVFAMIYKLMPRVHVAWRDVLLGSVVTSLLYNVGRLLIGLYVGKSDVASGFGAAGSLIVVFVWVYYSAQIFLMGAEFTWVYANVFGSMKGKFVDPMVAAVPQRDAEAGAAAPACALPTAPPAPTQAGPPSAEMPLSYTAAAALPEAALAKETAVRWMAAGLALGLLVRYAVQRLKPR
jgi:membrane protein